jgi:hypothetical protein
MSKPSGITIRVETWRAPTKDDPEAAKVKIAVRHSNGQFHGATNYPSK